MHPPFGGGVSPAAAAGSQGQPCTQLVASGGVGPSLRGQWVLGWGEKAPVEGGSGGFGAWGRGGGAAVPKSRAGLGAA